MDKELRSKLERELEIARQNSNFLKVQSETKERTIGMLHEQCNQYLQRNEDLIKKNTDLDLDLNMLRWRNEDLEKKMEHLSGTNLAVERSDHLLRARTAKLEENMSFLAQNNSNLDASVDKLRQRNLELEKWIETINKKNKSLEKGRAISRSNNAKLRAQVRDVRVPFSVPTFIRMTTPEIRLMIYRILLVNPSLGHPKWHGNDTKYGAKVKYGLSPNILRTCKKINSEALKFLYENNNFVFVCHRISNEGLSRFPMCPLVRYTPSIDYPHVNLQHYGPVNDFNVEGIPNISLIKRWNVFTADPWTMGFVTSIGGLCRVMSGSPPEHLRVNIVIRKYPLFRSQVAESAKRQIESVRSSFMVLRRIKNVTFGIARAVDIPDSEFQLAEAGNLQHVRFDEADEFENKAAVEIMNGDTEVENIYPMWRGLLSYAQSFERHEDYKAQMDPLLLKFRYLSHKTPTLIPENPFQLHLHTHDIESVLSYASFYAISQSGKEFRQRRDLITKALEPHYQRICTAMAKMQQYIEDAKVEGLLHPDFNIELTTANCDLECSMALEVLEYTAMAFKRETSPEMRMMMRRFPHRYSLDYNHLPREKALREMLKMMMRGEEQLGERRGTFMRGEAEMAITDNLIQLFKEVANDMQAQFMEIRRARRNLYSKDLVRWIGQEVGMEFEAREGVIDWTIKPLLFGARNQKVEPVINPVVAINKRMVNPAVPTHKPMVNHAVAINKPKVNPSIAPRNFMINPPVVPSNVIGGIERTVSGGFIRSK